MELKEAIKKYRKEAHLTQTELGKRIGVGLSTIARYESGEITPTTERLKILSKELNHDFFIDLVKSHIDSARLELKKVEEEISEPDFLMKALFKVIASESDYTVAIGEEDSMIFDDTNTIFVETEKIRKMYNRFIKHMRVEFQSFIEEQEDGTEK